MKQRVMVFVGDTQRAKMLANLRCFAAGSVPAQRAECLLQTLGKGRRSAAAFCEISMSMYRL
jgi:hypothetical protein